MKNLTWQNPEQLFVAQELINKVKSKCCGIKGKENSMPLIYKPYQATLANKEGQKLYYPRLVKFGKMVNTQKMAELIAEKASLTAGDVHNVIRNLMSVMREQLLNSRTVRLEGLGTFTMIAKAGGKGVELESKVSSSQITSLRCQFTPEYTRAANGSATRALTTGVEFVHIKDVAGSFVADDVVDKDPDDGDEPGGGGGEAPDPAA